MNMNQEEFNFLLRNLSEKNEEQGADNITKLRCALTNVIDSFITDFDKMSQDKKISLPPIFTMISLYIEQYSELFISQHTFDSKSQRKSSLEAKNLNMNHRNIEQEFTSFVISRMLRILANPEIDSLHSHSIKLIVLILEMFCINSPYGFLEIVGEIINSLHDLLEYDKDFFDHNQLEAKTLNRFTTDLSILNFKKANTSNRDLDESTTSKPIKKRSIVIGNHATCSFLQSNLVFILNEISVQFVNVIHDKLYEKLWLVLCEQLELGDKCLKIMSYNLILSILDLRVLPLNSFDFSNECLLYFFDCVLATMQFTYGNNSFMKELRSEK